MRVVFAVFLIAHAAVHGVMWTLPFTEAVDNMPFNPAESWLIGNRPGIAAGLAGLASAGFVIAAVAFAARAAWWPEALGASAAMSLVSMVSMVLFWSPYWTVGIILSAALGMYAWRAIPTV